MREFQPWENGGKRASIAMLGLIYPAFLGTFIVSFFQSYSALESTQLALAILLLIFFVIAYVETDYSKEHGYNPLVFLVDIGEVALMATLFMTLRVEDTGIERPDFWMWMCWLFLMPLSGRLVTPVRTWAYDLLCILAMTCCLGARYERFESWTLLQGLVPRFWRSTNQYFTLRSDEVATLLLWFLLVVYALIVFLDAGFDLCGKKGKDGEWVQRPVSWWHAEGFTPWAGARFVLAAGVCVICSI